MDRWHGYAGQARSQAEVATLDHRHQRTKVRRSHQALHVRGLIPSIALRRSANLGDTFPDLNQRSFDSLEAHAAQFRQSDAGVTSSE